MERKYSHPERKSHKANKEEVIDMNMGDDKTMEKPKTKRVNKVPKH